MVALTEQQQRIRAEAKELGYKTQPVGAERGSGFWWGGRRRTLLVQHPAGSVRFCCGPKTVWAEERRPGRAVYEMALAFPRYRWEIEDFTPPPLDELNGWLLTATHERDQTQAQATARRALRGAARDLLGACVVIMLNPDLAEWLDQHDPKALEQVRRAVELATSPDLDERITILALLDG